VNLSKNVFRRKVVLAFCLYSLVLSHLPHQNQTKQALILMAIEISMTLHLIKLSTQVVCKKLEDKNKLQPRLKN
jgi:hypothetical protein